VHAILVPLETERDLRLALSAEANDLVQVLIRLRVHSIGNMRQDHLVPLLQDGARLDLVHENTFAFKGITDWTFHKGILYCLLSSIPVKGGVGRPALDRAAAAENSVSKDLHSTFTVY
jgi:hypothetical protein